MNNVSQNVLIRFIAVVSVIVAIVCIGVPFILSILGLTDRVIHLFSYFTKSDI